MKIRINFNIHEIGFWAIGEEILKKSLLLTSRKSRGISIIRSLKSRNVK